jgi:hypothetical protein
MVSDRFRGADRSGCRAGLDAPPFGAANLASSCACFRELARNAMLCTARQSLGDDWRSSGSACSGARLGSAAAAADWLAELLLLLYRASCLATRMTISSTPARVSADASAARPEADELGARFRRTSSCSPWSRRRNSRPSGPPAAISALLLANQELSHLLRR